MQSIDPVASRHPARSRPLDSTALIIVLSFLLGACEPVLGPLSPLPDSAIAFVPPAVYQAWWQLTEACSGRLPIAEDIAWFVVPDKFVITPQGHTVARWSRGSDGARIVIAGAYVASELVVRHEMLHALLNHAGHPSEYFVDRCHLTWASWGNAQARPFERAPNPTN